MDITLLPMGGEDAGVLILVLLLLGICLYELVTGESMPSRFGGWVTTRENDPRGYWTSLVLMAAGMLFLVGRLAMQHLLVNGIPLKK
jgi:hypothetical protein